MTETCMECGCRRIEPDDVDVRPTATIAYYQCPRCAGTWEATYWPSAPEGDLTDEETP